MSIAARRYARALIDALPPEQAESGFEQLQKFSTLLSAQADAIKFLRNPTISTERRKELLAEICASLGLDKTLARFLSLLVERNRLDLMDAILSSYQALLDERLQIVRAKVTSAQPLDPDQQRALANKLEILTGKRVRVELAVDPGLIGGVRAQVGGTIYDGSIRQRLMTFRQRLMHS